MRFRWILSRFALSMLGVLAILGVITVGTSMFGLVIGEEFAPDTFERRSYWYYELPFVRWKVTPTQRTTRRPDLEQTLIDKKYITATVPPQRWDLVNSYHDDRFPNEGDSQILCRYLDTFESDDAKVGYWHRWTNDHPALAKILWPEVAKLARRQLYVSTPELFQAAAHADTPQQLRTDLDHVLSNNYERFAVVEADLGNYRAAADLFTDALSYDPNRAHCVSQRAACYERLAKSQPADQRPNQMETRD